MNEKTWPSRGQAGSVSLNNCHTSLPSTEPSQAQPSPCNLLNQRVTLSAQCEATERERERNMMLKLLLLLQMYHSGERLFLFRKCPHLHVVLQLRVTLLPAIPMWREQRRQGAVFQRDSAPATQHTISVSRQEGGRVSIELYMLPTDGEVTGRGCSTTDRICQGEYTVQSRHICEFQFCSGNIIISLFPSDGFMSSLGCQEKARVGHLYRGRDCENNQVEDTFERKCYCRYQALQGREGVI